MKLTVFALLLVGFAFAVLAGIFRSGMQRFDQQPRLHTSVVASKAVTPTNNAPLKKRLQPWLREPRQSETVRTAPTEALANAGQPIEETPLLVEEEPEEAAQPIDSATLQAWSEELQLREEALLAAEAQWMEEQAQILAAQESRGNVHPVNWQDQEAAASIEAQAAAAAEREAALVSLREELEANMAWLLEQENLQGLETIADAP